MSEPVLQVQDLAVQYEIHQGSLLRPRIVPLKAVDGVSFELQRGETLGVVGESGCGKSTLARAILGLVPAQRGKVLWLGEDLIQLDAEEVRKRRKEMQIVFQDPLASLNPRMMVGDIIAEPLVASGLAHGSELDDRIRQTAARCQLKLEHLRRYPHEFSGGQCQRIGIARALVLNPKLIICDEPVSALDVSIQAQIINLLRDLQRKLKLSLIFIAHDLAVVRQISDRVMVMYLGRSMEVAQAEALYRKPLHPYTSALVRAVPIPDPRLARLHHDTGLTDDMPSPLNPPTGCVFHTRCPYAVKRCELEVPALRSMANGDWVACHRAEELDLTVSPQHRL